MSFNKFELNFYQEKKWKHKYFPIEISKNDSDKVVEFLIYKNNYAFIRKMNEFIGDHYKNFICRRCLKSRTSENMLMIHKPKCESNDITTIKTSSESPLHSEKHILKNLLFFWIYAHFGTDNEKDISSVDIKTTKNYGQNPVLNGYRIESELEDVLQSGFYNSPLVVNNVDWFFIKVIKLENKLALYF